MWKSRYVECCSTQPTWFSPSLIAIQKSLSQKGNCRIITSDTHLQFALVRVKVTNKTYTCKMWYQTCIQSRFMLATIWSAVLETIGFLPPNRPIMEMVNGALGLLYLLVQQKGINMICNFELKYSLIYFLTSSPQLSLSNIMPSFPLYKFSYLFTNPTWELSYKWSKHSIQKNTLFRVCVSFLAPLSIWQLPKGSKTDIIKDMILKVSKI